MKKDVITQLVKEISQKTVKPDELLLSSGVLDSVSVVDLLVGLEQHFKVQLDIEDLEPEKLDSVNLIVNLLNEKLQAAENK